MTGSPYRPGLNSCFLRCVDLEYVHPLVDYVMMSSMSDDIRAAVLRRLKR